MKQVIAGVLVTVLNGTIPEEEAAAYVARGRELHGNHLSDVIAKLDPEDPDMIELEYIMAGTPFQRLRRITGYLVGTLDRWNNGKRAEEHDRVKHSADIK